MSDGPPPDRPATPPDPPSRQSSGRRSRQPADRCAAQPWRRLSPEIDHLQDEADVAQARLAEVMVISDAEGTVAGARVADLAAQQKTAWRRVSAARGRLTRARRDGDPDQIAAAQARVDARYAEPDALAERGITEAFALNDAGFDRVDELLGAMRTSWDATHRVTLALASDGIAGDGTEGGDGQGDGVKGGPAR